MNRKTRIFLVSGPAQALNTMAIIEEDKSSDLQTRDIAVLGNFGVSSKYDAGIIDACKNIIKTHNWSLIKNLTTHESHLVRLLESARYSEGFEMLYGLIDCNKADEVYMYRNAGGLSQLLAMAFDNSKIVIFGDAFGLIDSTIGHGYSHIDEVRVLLPIEYNKGFMKHMPLKIISKEALISAIDSMIEKTSELETVLSNLKALVDDSSALLTIALMSEREIFEIEHEVEMYVKAVKRNCEHGCNVFIKSHPRAERSDRTMLLTERLTKAGYKCIYLDGLLEFYSTEVICRYVQFSKVISTASTAGITVKYLYNCNVDFGIDDEDISRALMRNYLDIFTKGLRAALENIDTWDVKSLLYTFETSPLHCKVQNRQVCTLDEFYLWLTSSCYLENKTLSALLKNNGIYNVVVFGLGCAGKIIAGDLLKDNDIKTLLIDTSSAGGEYLSCEVFSVENVDSEVDAIILASTYNAHISEMKLAINNSKIKAKHIITLSELMQVGN